MNRRWQRDRMQSLEEMMGQMSKYMRFLAMSYLTCALAGCTFIGDPDWGVERASTIQSTPTKDCVQSVLEKVPGIIQVHLMPQGFRRGFATPDAIAYGFDIVTQSKTMKGSPGIQFVTRNGKQAYEAYYIIAHYAPPQSDVDVIRPIFSKLEQDIARKCELPELTASVTETCTHVSCPPLR